MEKIGAVMLPLAVGAILVFGYIKDVDVFDCFVEGAKAGLKSTVKILPTLIGLIVAVTMVRASGLLDAISNVLSPLASAIGISPDIIPLALLRPVSGGGSTAFARDLMVSHGPDSPNGMLASVLATSTETTFYAIAVYFGATSYKKLYYTVPAGLMGDLASFIFAVLTVRFM